MYKEVLLAHYPRFSIQKYNDIVRIFGSVENFWNCQTNDLKLLNWLPNQITSFSNWREKLNPEKMNKKLVQEGIRVIIHTDEDYPKQLKELFDPPFALFVRGDLKNEIPKFAVVGTRRLTQYGRQVVYKIVPELAKAGK